MTGEMLTDRYEALATVSQGGQATVLRAIDHQHDRVVALKVYPCHGEKEREVLLAEARVLLGLSPHPGLPMLRDDFFVHDRYVVVMDWIDGTDLGRVLEEDGEPGLARSVVVDCVAQVAAALDHLHSHDPPVVHGDVKPNNMIRGPTGRITLVDFGIAIVGRAHRRAGTRGYLAPEVAAEGLLTPAADIYGLAATAVALLTGRPPDGTRPLWEGIDPAEVGPLARALRRGLATDPARRPRSAGELAERLRAGRFGALPDGVVTFLANDIADAAALWDAHTDLMAAAVDRLDDVVAEVVERHGGHVVRSTAGDAWLSVFADASSAAAAALALHGRVRAARAARSFDLLLRAAVHTGEAELHNGNYHGLAAHQAGRLLSAAPPGRTVVSQPAADLMSHLPIDAVLFDLGSPAPADGITGAGHLFGLVDREADRFGLEVDRTATVGSDLVWLVCTDVEGSTQLLQSSPERYRTAIDRYRHMLAETCSHFAGTLVNSVEDRAVVAFPGPAEAMGAAVAAQQMFESARREADSIRVRIGIHVEQAGGPPEAVMPVSTATALAVCRAGHGGQILMSQTARRLAATNVEAGVSMLDLGEHRLTDLSQPQRLYQLAHPALVTGFPPLRTLENRPHNLPVQLTRFIGRRTELHQMADLLEINRLCTITGTGGAGKTRLALRVAAEVLGAFPDGVWVADLAGVSTGDMVASTVAAEIGVREGSSGTYATPRRQSSRSALDRLVDHLEYRTALVVLDNCEHVVEACTRVTEVLLRRCQRVRILATSREPLGIPGEVTYRLGPLELPPHDATVATIRKCASVRLFVDRAMLRRPDVSFSNDQTAVIASICQRVDGIPFAIELAAARVSMLGVAEIASTLDDRLGMLSASARATSARQPTLRAMIEWSDNLLSDRERTLLRRLSVFAGGFTLDGARHVCAGDGLEGFEIFEILANLVDKSLLETEPETSRFRLLEVTRQYAAERLSHAGEASSVKAAHLAWYLSLAERAEVELTGADQSHWLEMLEAEHDNLLVALASGQAEGNHDDARLAAALSQYWLVRGRLSEGRAWLESALARTPAPDALKAKTLSALGLLDCFAGDYDRVESLADEARRIAHRLESRRWEARADMLLGLTSSGEGRPDEAERYLRAAADGARAAGDHWCQSFALTSLGNVLALEGATRAARESYEESLAIRRHEGDTWGMAWVLFRLGVLATWEGRFEEALTLLEEALQRSISIGFGQGKLLALLGLGEALHAVGNSSDASSRFAEALTTARLLEEDTGTGAALGGLASAAVAAGDLDAAARWLNEPEANPADDSQRAAATRAALLRGRAALALVSGDARQAEAFHHQALHMRQLLGDKRAIIEELEALAVIAARHGDNRRAATLLAATDKWRSAMGFPVPPRDEAARQAATNAVAAGDGSLEAAWESGRVMSLEDAVALAVAAGGQSG